MRAILEYIKLSNIKKIIDKEEYFILWPSNDIYQKLVKLYNNKMIRSGLDYWILSKSETLSFLEDFSKDYIKNNLKVFIIPNDCDTDDVRQDLLIRKIHPFDFDKLDIEKIL